MASAAVAGLALGAALIVANARADNARSSVGNAGRVDATAPAVEGGVLPMHLQEFEAHTKEALSEGAVDRSAYWIIQAEIDKALAKVAAEDAQE